MSHLDDEAAHLVSETVFREGEDGWAEWVVHIEDDKQHPPRLFGLRDDGLIWILEGKATSRRKAARFLGQEEKLSLTYDMAKWLLTILPKALERKYGQ